MFNSKMSYFCGNTRNLQVLMNVFIPLSINCNNNEFLFHLFVLEMSSDYKCYLQCKYPMCYLDYSGLVLELFASDAVLLFYFSQSSFRFSFFHTKSLLFMSPLEIVTHSSTRCFRCSTLLGTVRIFFLHLQPVFIFFQISTSSFSN